MERDESPSAPSTETPTVEALVTAWRTGAVTRREFLRRARAKNATSPPCATTSSRFWVVCAASSRGAAARSAPADAAPGPSDPQLSTSSNDIRVSFDIFDNLVSRHPDGKLHPGLATEWKATAPTTWQFKLRQGVQWHNLRMRRA